MNTEIVTTTGTAVVQHRGDDIQVTAASSGEMQESQTALIEWSIRKIATMEAEASEMRAAYELALKNRWKYSTLKRHANLADRRVIFYRKLKSALEAGYIIVPSFPVEVFAVRSSKDKPTKFFATKTNHWASRKQEVAATLSQGKGDYVNPVENVYVEKTGDKDASGRELYSHFTFGQWDELDFPINMAKPQIMEATTRAMALKIFDDFGVLPGVRKNIDPIIVARIRDPRVPHKFAPKMVSFIIKWHLDTATL